MSDGPHRSLPLRPRWKRVAECADKDVFSEDTARQWLDAAIHADFSAEVSDQLIKGLRAIFCDSDQASFLPVPCDDVENLRLLTNGTPLASLVVDCAVAVASAGQVGEAALDVALTDAVQELVERNRRGMEEHYRRESGPRRSGHFKDRINSIQNGHSASAVVSQIMSGAKARVTRRPPKQSGIEDGVPLQ